jgi:hypothetical protein
MWVLQKRTMSPTWIYGSATCVDEEEDRGEHVWKAARGTIFRVKHRGILLVLLPWDWRYIGP